MAKADVIIRLKPTLMDAQGATVRRALNDLGYDEVSDVRIGKVIELTLDGGGDMAERIEKMCEQLLANPVIEDYEVTVRGEDT